MTTLIATLIAAYLLGGIPTAYLLGKRWHEVDIRTLGSHNVGTSNAAKSFGPRAGAIVLLADATKGALAAGLALALNLPPWGAALVALAVVVGHNFSPYLRLSGGRGVATALGVSTVMVPAVAFVGLIVGAVWFVGMRNIVGAGVLAFAVTNVLVVATGAPMPVLAMCGAVSMLVLGTHLARERSGTRRTAMEEVER
ncbi:MAG: glycerol-3-phosphate acyltransferase [Chloroflexi bacterium]|nr:glycerol-3-phosphate acyltransferase [Chloroflexota bacterium]MDA1173337.1 glycerol-3-phosphate acyltransferase [Chloroflexota bacterium]